jgi:hypothetical protein
MTEQQKRANLAAIVAADPNASRAKRRWEVARRLLTILTATATVAALGLLIYLAGSANAGAEAIRDCTTPGGQCYERGQAQQAKAVAQIVDAQRKGQQQGSVVTRENLTLTRANAQRIQIILGILDQEYPEAAAVVRKELGANP